MIPSCLIFSGRINGDVFRLQSRSARIQAPNLVVQVPVNTNRIYRNNSYSVSSVSLYREFFSLAAQ